MLVYGSTVVVVHAAASLLSCSLLQISFHPILLVNFNVAIICRRPMWTQTASLASGF